MKRTLFFIIALVFIASLSFSQTKVNINNLEEYGGAMFKIDDDKPYSGRVFALYKNTDNKKLEGLYRDGLKNGKWTWWHKNGDIYSKGSFRAGLMSGQWEFYYSNGKIMAVGHYRNGDGTNEDKNGIPIHGRQSKWAFWHKNGFKSDEQTWKNGKKDGVFTSWHYTGVRASEITYINGNINGMWTYWNERGEKEREGTVEEYNILVRLEEEAKAAEEMAAAKMAAEGWFQKGYNAGMNGEYNAEISLYLKAIELNPDYANAYINLGIAYGKQDNYTKAIQIWEKTIELNPDDANAYINLGIAYGEQNNYTKAIQSYEKALELKPDGMNTYVKLGIAYGEQNNYTKAIQSYEKAIELKPDYALAYWNRSISKDSVGDKSGGLEDTKKAARLGHTEAQDWLKENGYDW